MSSNNSRLLLVLCSSNASFICLAGCHANLWKCCHNYGIDTIIWPSVQSKVANIPWVDHFMKVSLLQYVLFLAVLHISIFPSFLSPPPPFVSYPRLVLLSCDSKHNHFELLRCNNPTPLARVAPCRAAREGRLLASRWGLWKFQTGEANWVVVRRRPKWEQQLPVNLTIKLAEWVCRGVCVARARTATTHEVTSFTFICSAGCHSGLPSR